MRLLPARAALQLQLHQGLMLFLMHAGFLVLLIMQNFEVSFLHEKKKTTHNTQGKHLRSCSLKYQDMDCKGFYNILGEIHCVNTEILLESEGHSSSAGMVRLSNSRM